jgi:hypothetical protein
MIRGRGEANCERCFCASIFFPLLKPREIQARLRHDISAIEKVLLNSEAVQGGEAQIIRDRSSACRTVYGLPKP